MAESMKEPGENSKVFLHFFSFSLAFRKPRSKRTLNICVFVGKDTVRTVISLLPFKKGVERGAARWRAGRSVKSIREARHLEFKSKGEGN